MLRFSFSMIVAIGAMGIFGTVLNAGDEDKVSASKVLCPTTGEPVDFLTSTDTDDGPVYFCCKGCIELYKEDPAKYAKQTSAQRAALAKLPKIQTKCPISGGPVNLEEPGGTAMHDGEKIGFCCGGCATKFEKDPKKFAGKLAGSYTYQTICPVMGEPIDPNVSVTLSTGDSVYVCCKGCVKRLRATPEKYNDVLVAQGIKVDWSKEKK